MSVPDVNSFVRTNWHLLLVFVLVLAAIPVVAMRQSSEKASPQEMQAAATGRASVAALQIKPRDPRETSRDVARKTIASHQQRLAADPQSADAPALLCAMGNLYRQRLSDYEQAANCFERMVRDYPDAPNVREAYLQLVICYERLGDTENRTRILRKMLSDFPSDSEEHLYASRELGL